MDLNGVARATAAWRWACALDVMVAKPGNVSVAASGHRMTAAMFLDSARAAAPELFVPGRCVGERIEAAVRATWATVQCNTNLGIVLLSAPLAAALERCVAAEALAPPMQPVWRAAVAAVLDQLDVHDAQAAYRGIAQAQPGGLGRAAEHDVAQVPQVDLRSAMAVAASRDSIARQYAQGFTDVFEFGLPAFQQELARARQSGQPLGDAIEAAVLHTFLSWLAAWPDAHIVRKHGAALAQTVTARAQALRAPVAAASRDSWLRALSTWDIELKTAGINPGTSADLTVATVFVAACLDPSLANGPNAASVVA